MRHIHYVTKEITLEALRDTGYEVVDSFYTRWGIDLFYPSWDVVRQKDTPIKTGLRKASSARPVRAQSRPGGTRYARVVADGARALTPRCASSES
jgi:hypothetical protein